MFLVGDQCDASDRADNLDRAKRPMVTGVIKVFSAGDLELRHVEEFEEARPQVFRVAGILHRDGLAVSLLGMSPLVVLPVCLIVALVVNLVGVRAG